MKQLFYLLPVCLLFLFVHGCVIDTDDDDNSIEIPAMMNFSAKVDKIEAIESCEGDGTTGKGDIYTRITLHKNDEPGGSSWGTLAEVGEIVVELSRGQSIENPGIEVSKEIEPFDKMRVEYILKAREVDPSGTQVQEIDASFMAYSETLGCWVEETFSGHGDECLPGSLAGTSHFSKTMQTRLTDHNCDVIITWTVSLTPIE